MVAALDLVAYDCGMPHQQIGSWIRAALALIALAGTGIVDGEPPRLSSYAGEPAGKPLTGSLPPVEKAAMSITPDSSRALSVLSFDDGTCEAGLGITVRHTALVEFDVPTQCLQTGLMVVEITARVNTYTATLFAWGQAGPTPPRTFELLTAPMQDITGLGPCPATGFASRAISGVTITGTDNFFAGMRYGINGGFVGRDTNGPRAMRHWLGCPSCGMSLYSPTDLSGFGFVGNFLIRVAVEDENCIPVELMDFVVVD